MTELYLNRDRRALMLEVGAGTVYRSAGGCDLKQVRRGQNIRVDRRLRELTQAGWVRLAADARSYELTPAGRAVLPEPCGCTPTQECDRHYLDADRAFERKQDV